MNYPPVDSLYKFCALSGLVLIIFSIYYPETIMLNLESKIKDNRIEAIVCLAEQKFLQARIDKMEKAISRAIAEQKGEYVLEVYKLILPLSDGEMKDIIFEIEDRVRDFEIAKAKAEYNLEETKHQLKKLKRIHIITYVTIAIGFLLAVFGFYKWYYKIQIFQDIAIKKSVERDQQEA